jgi:cobalt-zinc-cadmium efflux system protein
MATGAPRSSPALFNAGLLLVAVGGIIVEAVNRLQEPAAVSNWTVVVVAALGIAINGGTALLFLRGRHGDLNIRGAYLHMAADAGVFVRGRGRRPRHHADGVVVG